MPSHRSASAPARRSLLRSLVPAGMLAVIALLSAPAVASADTTTANGTTSTLTGQVVQTWADDGHEGDGHEDDGHEDDGHGDGEPAEAAAGPQTYIETPDGTTIPIDTETAGDLPLDATVAVTVPGTRDGAPVQPALPVLGSEILTEAPPVPTVPARRFTNEVTVALVAPVGSSPDDTTPEQIAGLVDDDVAPFWAEQTDGAVRLGVTSVHPAWLTTTAGCSSAATLWNEVAGKVGFTAGPGRHLLVYVPPTLAGCEYALAEVGRAPASGGRIYVRDAAASVIAHELGHNFGLGHSSGRQCDASVDAGACRTAPYRDFYDVMGVSWGELGSLNAVQADRLGVLPVAAQVPLPVSASATAVTLSPLSGRSGTRAVRLTDAAGVDYWLEYRPATGRDAWLGAAGNRYGLDSGVLVRRVGAFPDTSLLLDGTPSGSTGWDADLRSSLPVGAPVALADGQFSVTVRSISPQGAVVAVVPTPPATAPAPVPAPEQAGAGQLLPAGAAPAPGTAAPAAGTAAPAAGTAAQVPAAAPVEGDVRVAAPVSVQRVSPVLHAAAEPAGSGGLVIAAAATVLGGALLLVVRRVRRPRLG